MSKNETQINQADKGLPDHLERDQLVEQLKNVITTYVPPRSETEGEEGLVMCIDGGYGTGKTWL